MRRSGLFMQTSFEVRLVRTICEVSGGEGTVQAKSLQRWAANRRHDREASREAGSEAPSPSALDLQKSELRSRDSAVLHKILERRATQRQNFESPHSDFPAVPRPPRVR